MLYNFHSTDPTNIENYIPILVCPITTYLVP